MEGPQALDPETYQLYALTVRSLPLSKAQRLAAWWFLHHQAEGASFSLLGLQDFDLGLDKQVVEQAEQKAALLMEHFEQSETQVLVYAQPGYPDAFQALGTQAPLTLFVKGDSSLLQTKGVAIIGTRKPSEEGRAAAYQKAKEQSEMGKTIVSGLALGCDTAAHLAALENGGKTIATLPCPQNKLYPPENIALAAEIAEQGCLISEYLPKQKMHKAHFIERDKHQALLSETLYMAESEAKGGALHAMRYGAELERPLFVYKPSSKDLWQSKSFAGNRQAIKELDADIWV